jgi:hypothetical protein
MVTGLYGASDAGEVITHSTVGMVARTTAVAGLVAVCLGSGLWGASTATGTLRTAGVRGIALGIALLTASVGAALFAGINYALGVGWSP